MYPPDLSIKENPQSFLQAMHTAGVPKVTAGKMLNIFVENTGSLVDRLTLVGNYFNMSRKDSFRLYDRTCSKIVSCLGFPAEITANQATSRTIDPAALRRSSVNGFVGEVTKDKMFRGNEDAWHSCYARRRRALHQILRQPIQWKVGI